MRGLQKARLNQAVPQSIVALLTRLWHELRRMAGVAARAWKIAV